MVNAPVTESEFEAVKAGQRLLVVSPSGEVTRWVWTRGGLVIGVIGRNVIDLENARANEEGGPQPAPIS